MPATPVAGFVASHSSSDASRRHRCGALALLVACGFAGRAWAAGNQLTGCVNLCPSGWPTANPCVVQQTVTIVPGSVIDCGARDVQVTGGDLVVHDGKFVLKAQSLTVTGHNITADCPAQTGERGFTIQVTSGITVGNSSKLQARCAAGGGTIALAAGGAVTIGGMGIDASGTASGAAGGVIRIEAGGALTTTVELRATTTGGTAPGGRVDIRGLGNVTIGDGVTVNGSGTTLGGMVTFDVDGDLALNGTVDASTASGTGGNVNVRADGSIQTSRPIRARGTGGTSSGGFVGIEGGSVTVNADVTATGGIQGGEVHLESRRGRVALGTGAPSNFFVDVGTSSPNPGQGGDIVLRSQGNDVTLGPYARVWAKGSGGDGGGIAIEGVTVSTSAASQVVADGTTGGNGITIEARDQMTLSGTVSASNGGIDLVYRSSAPVLGGGVACPCNQSQDANLPAPCGDGIVRAGVEVCDEPDLNDQTCATQGYASGTLGCNASCNSFVVTGCL